MEKIDVSMIPQFQRNPAMLSNFIGSDALGYYVHPTIIETSDPRSVTMVEEIFGPVLSVLLLPI